MISIMSVCSNSSWPYDSLSVLSQRVHKAITSGISKTMAYLVFHCCRHVDLLNLRSAMTSVESLEMSMVGSTSRVWMGGLGYKCQLSVKILAICRLSVKFS